MEQIITKGIVLKSIDYGDKDKIITLFSQDYGRISAILKGVRKLTAKMKFASQPFCFAEYNLVGKKELYTVAGASEVDSFFDITQNYAKMVCGSALLEMTSNVTTFGEPNKILFDALALCLKSLAVSDIEPDIVLMRFALGVLKVSGYQLNLVSCRECGKQLINDMVVFDADTGELCCRKCSPSRYIPLSARTLEIMQTLAHTPLHSLENIVLMDNEAKEFRHIIMASFEIHFGVKLKSLNVDVD